MHTDESFFVRQLGTILQEDPTNLNRELSRLEKIGILSSTRQGNLKLFSVNKRNPLFKELRGLIIKTTGVHGRLRSALEDIQYHLYVRQKVQKSLEAAEQSRTLTHEEMMRRMSRRLEK